MTDVTLAPTIRAEIADGLDSFWLPPDLRTFILIPNPQSAFHIGKYPITNDQYQQFLGVDDYTDTDLWQNFPKFAEPEKGYELLGDWGDAGLKWLAKLPEYRKRDETGKLYPEYWHDPRFGIARRGVPVVGVSWPEANAFCQWLKRHWHDPELGYAVANPQIDIRAMTIRLPSEAEWLAAASLPSPSGRGAGGEGESKKPYPWSRPDNPLDSEAEILHRANTYESGIGRTTPVGMYPLSASHPHGVMDLAGNVWEWQANYLDEDRDWLALRGGSWYYSQDGARLSARGSGPPDVSGDNLGFRVVVAFPSRS